MKITDKQIEELREYLPGIEEIIMSDDLYKLETEIDGLITEIGLTEDQEWLNRIGKKLQKLYDEIFEQNREDETPIR